MWGNFGAEWLGDLREGFGFRLMGKLGINSNSNSHGHTESQQSNKFVSVWHHGHRGNGGNGSMVTVPYLNK